MSIVQNAKEFFFGPTPENFAEDPYYDDDMRYETSGSAAYQPHARRSRDYYEDYGDYEGEPEGYRGPHSRQPTIRPITLTRYSDAARIGEAFREGDAVVFNVTNMDRDEARRAVDFAAGVCMALRGSMEKLAASDFALIPRHAIIDHADLERAVRTR